MSASELDLEAIGARAAAATKPVRLGDCMWELPSRATMEASVADVPALCAALRHERRVAAAWRRLANARKEFALARDMGRVTCVYPTSEATRVHEALKVLRDIGIEPDAEEP